MLPQYLVVVAMPGHNLLYTSKIAYFAVDEPKLFRYTEIQSGAKWSIVEYIT